MMRLVPITVALLLAAAPAFAAGGLAKMFIPKGTSQVAIIQNAYRAMPADRLGQRGRAMLQADVRALVPMLVVISPTQLGTLTGALAGDRDWGEVVEVLEAVDASAREYALGQAKGFLSADVKDDQLDDAKTFAKEYLVMFGPHLDADVKAKVFRAAAELERRRLAIEERKEMSLAQVMREMSFALTDERAPGVVETVGPSASAPLKDVTDPPYTAVLKQFDGFFIKALESHDPESLRKWLGVSYAALENELAPGMERIAAGLYGPAERDELLQMREQVDHYHYFMNDLIKTPRSRSANARSAALWEWPAQVNDAGRDRLLALIDRAQAKGRARTPDIEKLLPAESFAAVEALSATDDGRVVPHLKKILKFYGKSLADAGEGSYRREVERKLATGFDGKVPTLQRVWEIWTEAMGKPGNQGHRTPARLVKTLMIVAGVSMLAGAALWILGIALSGSPSSLSAFKWGIGAFWITIGSLAASSVSVLAAESPTRKFGSFRSLKWRTVPNWLPWASQPGTK